MATALCAPVVVPAAEPLQVTVDLADAMGVGLSILALIKCGRIPNGAAEPFERVAQQLVSSARAAAGTVGR